MKIESWADSIVDFGKDTYNDAIDTAKDIKKDFIPDTMDAIGDAWEFGSNVVGETIKLATGESDVYDNVFDDTQKKYNFSKEILEESKQDYASMDMVKGIGGQLWTLGADTIVGNELEKNIKSDIKYKDFQKELELKEKKSQAITKKQITLSEDKKYDSLYSFQEETKAEYIKIHGSVISEEDFLRFRSERFSKLDGVTASRLKALSADLGEKMSELQKESDLSQNEINSYLDENIEGGSDLYKKYNADQQKKIEENAYLKAQTKNYLAASKTVRDEVNQKIKGMSNASTYTGLEKQIDTIVDMESANREFLVSILGNKKLQGHEKLASQWKGIMDTERKLAMNILEATAQKRGKPGYKELTEADFRDKIEMEEWSKFSDADKKQFKVGEAFKTSMSIAVDNIDIRDKSLYNPSIYLDYFSKGAAGLAKFNDEIWDYNNEVPHYVKQQLRALKYSDAGMGKKAASIVMYNLDAIASIGMASGLTKVGLKATAGATNALTKIAGAKLPFTMGFDKMGLVGKAVGKTTQTGKTLVVSQIYGASADTIIDINMASGKTTQLEQFNQITNTLFDGLQFIGGQGIKAGYKGGKTSLNRVLYGFLHESEKEAVDKVIDIAKSNGTKMNRGEAKTVLDEMSATYHTFTDKSQGVKVLREENGLYNFVADNLAQMEKHDIDAVLAGNGLALKRSTGFEGYDPTSFSKMLTKLSDENIDLKTKALYRKTYEKGLDDLMNKIEVGHGNEIGTIASKYKKDEGYIKASEEYKDIITEIKTIKNPRELPNLFKELSEKMKDITYKYSNKTKRQNFVLINNGVEYKVAVDKIEELAGKDFMSLMKEGKITLNKEQISKLNVSKLTNEGEYRFKGSKESEFEERFKTFLDSQDDIMEEWIKNNGDIISSSEIIKQLNNLLFGKGTTKTSWIKGTIEEQEELLTSFATLLNDMMADFLGPDLIASKPTYINKALEVNKETGFASKDQIVQQMSSNDSYFNISFGSFINGKPNEAGQAIYMGFGKKTLDNIEIKTSIDAIKNTEVLKEKMLSIRMKIFSLGSDGSKINIDKGIKQAASTLSFGNTDGLFKDGKIDHGAIKKMVNDNLETKNNSEIINFIYNSVKDSGEGDAMILKPIIYNLIYQYSQHRDMIKKAIPKLGDNQKFDEVFSAVLLSDKVKQYITEKVVNDTVKFKTINLNLQKAVDAEWATYKAELNSKLESLELDREDLIDMVTKSDGVYELDKALSDIDKDIHNLKVTIGSKGISKNMMYKKLFALNSKFLDSKMKGFQENLSKSNGLKNEIKTIEDQIDSYMTVMDDISKASDSDKEYIYTVLNKIKDGEASDEFLANIKDKAPEKMHSIIDKLVNIKKMMDEEPHIVKNYNDFDTYFEDAILNSDSMEYLLEHNPLASRLEGFMSGQDYKMEGLDEKIADIYKSKDVTPVTPAAPAVHTVPAVVEYEGRWTRKEVEKDTDRVYLFGDNTDDRLNTKHIPSSTQAVIRGLDNAIGIDTKKNIEETSASYLTDTVESLEKFKKHVDEQIEKAKATGKTIVISKGGIGTDKAQLEKRAPKLFKYLTEKLDALKKETTELKTDKDTNTKGYRNFLKVMDQYIEEGSMTVKEKDILGAMFTNVDDRILEKLSYREVFGMRAGGQYGASKIGLNKKSPIENIVTNFLHEFGHFSDDLLLTTKERTTIDNFLNKNKDEIRDTYKSYGFDNRMSTYFVSNRKEFIAQEFAHYVTNKEIRFKSISDIIKKLYKGLTTRLQMLSNAFLHGGKKQIKDIKGYSDIEDIFSKLWNTNISKDRMDAFNSFYKQYDEIKIKKGRLIGSGEYKGYYKIQIGNNKTDYITDEGGIYNHKTSAGVIKFKAKDVLINKFNKDGTINNEGREVILRESLELNNGPTGLGLKERNYFLDQIDKVDEAIKPISNTKSGYDLYHSNDEFKSLVDGLYIPEGMTDEKITEQVGKNKKAVRKFVRKLFEGEKVLFKGKNVTDELIDDMIKGNKIYKQLRSIKNKVETSGDKWINFKGKENDKGFTQYYTSGETKVVDRVMQFDNMADMNIVRLNGINAKTIASLMGAEGKELKFAKTGSKITKENSKGELYITDETVYDLGGSIESLKYFSDIFNDAGKYKDELGIMDKFRGYEDYSFMGGIGDKDGLLHLYKMPDGMVKEGVSSKERKAMNIEYYKYEYAYAQGYLKHNAKITKISDIEQAVGKVGSLKELQKELEKFEDNLISETDITKREASNASTRNTFDGLKKDVRVLIKKRRIDPPAGMPKPDKLTKASLENLKGKNKEVYEVLNDKLSELGGDIGKLQTYIKDTYHNDLDDGTSWISNSLGKLRGDINGIHPDEFKKGKYRQIKDHFYGEVGKALYRIMGKTLFNMSDIQSSAKNPIDNAVIIGASSLKLGKDKYEDLLETGKEVTIYLNGNPHQMIEMPKADTSFFKDATSDSFKAKDEVSVSDSIKNSLSQDAIDKMNKEQMSQIEILFDQLKNDLTSHNVDITTFSAIDKMLTKVPYDFGLGYGTNSVVNAKVKSFTQEMHRIINKPTSDGEAMFIRESSTKIKENEVIMHEDSLMVKKIREEVSEGKFGKEYSELDPKEKTDVDDNLFTVGYRYPVPNSYNIGTYKIRLNTEVAGYEGKNGDPYYNMGTEQVIPHPESTYMKLQGDNDGDHIFFISSNSSFGKTLTEDILDIPKTDGNLWDTLSQGFKNKFIALEQVEPEKAGKRTLLETRLANTEAKLMIGQVAATIRTLKSMTTRTGNELLRFNEISSQTLQDTLDFGKTGKLSFDQTWKAKLIEAAGLEESMDLHKEIDKKSKAYGKIKLDSILISRIHRGEIMKNKSDNLYNEVRGNITGGKGELLEMIYKNRELTRLIKSTTELHSLPFFMKNLMPEDKMFDAIRNGESNGFKYKNLQYVSKNNTEIRKLVSGIVDKFVRKSGDVKLIEAYEAVKKFVHADKKEKGKLSKKFLNKTGGTFFKDDINTNGFFDESFKDNRLVLATYAMFHGEGKLYNFLSNKELKGFLDYSDKNFDAMLKKHRLKMKPTQTLEEAKERQAEIQKEIDMIEGGNMVDENMIQAMKDNIDEIQKQIDNQQYIVDNITDAKVETIETPKFKETYDMPYIESNLVDIDGKDANEVMNHTDRTINLITNKFDKMDKILKLKVSSLFEKWMPDYLATYNILRDDIHQNIGKRTNEEHVFHFSNTWLPNSQSISYLLKKGNISNYSNYFDGIQQSFIKIEGGKFVMRTEEEYINKIRDLKTGTVDGSTITFNNVGGENILKDEKFLKALKQYSETVATDVATQANRVQKAYGYDLVSAYKGNEGKLVRDLIEAKNSDGQLAMAAMGYDKNGFEKKLSDRIDVEGSMLKKAHIKTMMDVLTGGDQGWGLSLLSELKSIHYSLSYGTGSFFLTGNGLLTGLAQVTPNYVELKAYVRSNVDELKEASRAMNSFNLLGGDNVLEQGTGLSADIKPGMATTIANKILHAVDGESKEFLGAKYNTKDLLKGIDMVIRNPLGAGDFPLERTRKLVAVAKTMKAMGIKNAADLEKRIALAGNTFSGTFRSQVAAEFANSGGGVTSASRIYRDTVFAHGANYIGNNAFTRVPINALGYLMGWSFHKAATAVEKTLAIPTGIAQMVRGDIEGGMANIKDGLATYMMYGKSAIYTTGILLKVQKYEEDPNGMLTFEEFQKSFNNSVVSLDILFGRHIDNYKTASEYGDEDTNELAFTMTGVFDQMIRLYKQPKVIFDLFSRIDTLSKTNGKSQYENFMQALHEVAEDHWASYGRFAGIKSLENAYADQMVSSKAGLLLTGGFTKEEEIFNEGFRFKKFKSFTDKGIGTALFNSLSKISPHKTSYSLGLRNMNDMKDTLLKDPELDKLVHGGYLGKGSFDLEEIFGTSEEDLEVYDDLYKDLQKYTYSDWSKDSDGKYGALNIFGSDNIMYKKRLDKALKAEGFDLEYLMSISDKTPMLLKKLSVLEVKHKIKTPLVIAEMVRLDIKQIQKDMKKEGGRKTEDGYDSLYGDMKQLAIREGMIKNQELLSLNNAFVGDVIDSYISSKKKDTLESFEKMFAKDSFFNEKNAIEFIQRSQVISDNFLEGSSSVGKLNSRWVNLFSGMDDSQPEMTAMFVTNMLQKIEDLPIPKVNKLANQAAAISGLSKTNYGLLSDNKEFNKLSEASQSLLANWLYKTSNEALDFDAEAFNNKVADIKGGGSGSSYFRQAYKPKGSSFGGARPNYSKQFEPMRKLMDGKQGLFKKDPAQFLNSQYQSAPGINPMRFPIQKQYMEFLIKEMFNGFRSDSIVQQGVETFDKGPKTSKLKTGRVKKVKVKKETPTKRKGFKFQKGVLEEFPLAK